MPIVVEIIDGDIGDEIFEKIFSYFTEVDERFSTYKNNSEISKINRGEISEYDWSEDMKEVFKLSDETKKNTMGYFDIKKSDGKYDPSGLVKGWAIWNAAKILDAAGCKNFYVEAGGDIEVRGKNLGDENWSIGIRDPFDKSQKTLLNRENRKIVKVLSLSDKGIATSGSYLLGDHIYDPHDHQIKIIDVVSLTVIGPNIYEADRFATAAFAMGKEGIYFIERLNGFEGYMIDKDGIATKTSGFDKYVLI